MMRGIWLFLILCVMTATCADAAKKKPRNLNNIKKEQQAARKAIQQTSEQITAKEQETRRTLNTLNSINAEIAEKEQQIKTLNTEVDSIDRHITALNDTIAEMQKHVEALKQSYAQSVKRIKMGREGSMSQLAFIFSSDSFLQAYRRMRYLKQFSKWREKKTADIANSQKEVEAMRDNLVAAQNDRNTTLTKINAAKTQLNLQQEQTSQLADNLKKESASLRKVLREKERQARELDRELERLIAEEQARQERLRKQEEERRLAEERRIAEEKRQAELAAAQSKKKKDSGKKSGTKRKPAKETAQAAPPKQPASSKPASTAKKATPAANLPNVAESTRKLTGSFESNKGRLLFPVEGRYKIVRPFGRQQHPTLRHVTTDNSGIDIEAKPGAAARAIFAGKVSAVFRQPGFNTIVMIRHGQYLTIYANLGDISVKTGEEVKAGQTIGHIYVDTDDNNRSIMHFELRKEKIKLNPSAWVK